MNKKPTCYECVHLKDTFGNYVKCMFYAEKNCSSICSLIIGIGDTVR